MATRPYQRKSVSDLEAIFARSPDDPFELNRLAEELIHRTVPKARVLARKVNEALARLDSRASPREPVANTTVPSHPTPAQTSSKPPRQAATPAVPQPGKPPPATGPQIDGQTIGLGPLPSFSPSGKANKPRALLAAWTALEALSPQSYKQPKDMAAGDSARVVLLERGLPWGPMARSKPNHILYFEVILGAIALDKATDELVRVFGEDEERSRPDGRKAAIASVLVDKTGCVLQENGIAVSSFAWALKPALELKLGSLGAWPQVEPRVTKSLEEMICRHDEDGKPIPLDLNSIFTAHQWLVSQFDVPRHLVETPTFALKVFHYFKAKTPPEPSLLNSFYLEDLGKVSGLLASDDTGAAIGAGLRRYIGIARPREKADLLSPPSAIEPLVAPSLIPQARWPSDGGHPLVLLQQAAVNAARVDLVAAPGIMGVNGPPGTGKTTLLRDIVAGCVLDRATAMARFEKPSTAFNRTGERLSFGSNAFLHFYRLDDTLKGHEIVVASSNNKAVENISKELPLKQANGRHQEMAYFRSISDRIANPPQAGYAGNEGTDHNGDDRGGESGDAANAAPVETWGLIAAVLGNSQNRFLFQQGFWWDEERSFRTYLKAARGNSVMREITDERSGTVIKRVTPRVVERERPATNEADAAMAWRKARATFLGLKQTVEAEIARIEAVRHDLSALKEAVALRWQLTEQRPHLAQTLGHAERAAAARRQDQAKANARLARDRTLLDSHLASRPGFFARLFGTARWNSWGAAQQTLSAALQQAGERAQAADLAVESAATAQSKAQYQLRELDRRLSDSEQSITRLSAASDAARKRLGKRLIDELFFKRSHEEIHLTAPWLPDEVHRLREDLFAAALVVHKAFIDASAQPLQNNLGLLMAAMTGGALPQPAQRALLPDLWSSLFMVVPSVSTTFASIHRMFGEMPPESIGWLLIDEAGQALPQAAVGAILRAKRSIVVGDPLQIPPVVSLPEKLNAKICTFFGIDREEWSAPAASAQTLADQASLFKSTFATDSGEREVGLPLLVHRRCQNPMFAISNTIAYAGQMVHAVTPKFPGPIRAALGSSRWIDVNGTAETKWSPSEGDRVLRMLWRLVEAGVTNPDLFIVTPFKIVEQEMRQRLEREAKLLRALGVQADRWSRDRVGTIHTFQGREADTVILLLGAPNAHQHRARQWAASPPNIINVAVSRAKENIYVVGSAAAWTTAGTSLQVLQQELARSIVP